MGYTHYWYRDKEIPQGSFDSIVSDFSKLLPLFKVLDIKLANGLGEGSPEINKDAVYFNGVHNCGHKRNGHVSLPWPADIVKPGVAVDSEISINGSWCAGVTLQQRTCDGSCDYETFAFPRVLDEDKKPVGRVAYLDMNGSEVLNPTWKVSKYFDFTKTAFRPYDLAVCAFLIIAKHHLGSALIVHSDGDFNQWSDALKLVQNAFGYDDFTFDPND
jgi:hypothetical protein